jgi:hypothetical protein
MGAHSSEYTFTAKTRTEAIAAAGEYQRQCQHEYGHGPYTGHLGTAGIGADVLEQQFDTVEAALEYIWGQHDKWDLPMLARISGTDTWVLAGMCAS